MHYFKLQKLELKQLIDNMAIDIYIYIYTHTHLVFKKIGEGPWPSCP